MQPQFLGFWVEGKKEIGKGSAMLSQPHEELASQMGVSTGVSCSQLKDLPLDTDFFHEGDKHFILIHVVLET